LQSKKTFPSGGPVLKFVGYISDKNLVNLDNAVTLLCFFFVEAGKKGKYIVLEKKG